MVIESETTFYASNSLLNHYKFKKGILDHLIENWLNSRSFQKIDFGLYSNSKETGKYT